MKRIKKNIKTTFDKKGKLKYHELVCSECGKEKVRVEESVVKVIGPKCVANYGPAIIEKKVSEPTGFPKGWKFFKQFVHADGRVFEKGEEREDLKGTLPPTVIEKKPKLTKREREQKKLEKEKKAAQRHERKMKLLKKEKEKKLKKIQQKMQEQHNSKFFE